VASEELLQAQVQRLLDIHEIQNLMGRYEYLHMAGRGAESASLFALHTPGVKVEIAQLGVYDGPEGVRKFFAGVNERPEHERIGVLVVHTLTTPVIEVAGDGRTAQGVWISPGVETGPASHTAAAVKVAPASGHGKIWASAAADLQDTTEMRAEWAWVKYGIDFVREDGHWKFWHFHVYRIFSTRHDKSWAEPGPRFIPPFPDDLKPDRGNTHDWSYRPDVATEHVPAPPDPYETWDDARSYVPARSEQDRCAPEQI
jgi:hypothetical protein